MSSRFMTYQAQINILDIIIANTILNEENNAKNIAMYNDIVAELETELNIVEENVSV